MSLTAIIFGFYPEPKKTANDNSIREKTMTKVSRRALLGAIATTPALSIIGMPRVARAAEVELKYGNNLPVSHPLNIRSQEAAERVKRETNGRIEIKIFPNNQLGGDTDMLSQVRNGGITFFTPSALVIATLVPVAAPLCGEVERTRILRLPRTSECSSQNGPARSITACQSRRG
jgi:Bacterial extracellular solute-binding protein, family 7